MPQGRATVFTRRQERLACGNETWKYFLEHAVALADRHGVEAHSLLLSEYSHHTVAVCSASSRLISDHRTVTRTLSVNDSQVYDRSPPPLLRPGIPNAIMHHHTAHFGARTHGFGSPFGGPVMTPNLVYLFTSSKGDVASYITDDPMGRPRPHQTRSTNWCFSFSSGW